jgi:hypothetical protein
MDKKALEQLMSFYNWWMGAATIAVALGILGEYLTHFIFEKEARRNKLEMALTILFGVAVLCGVVGEFLCGHKLSQVSDELQRIADKEVADANLQAAQANERAARAERELLAERQHTANRDIAPEEQNAISQKLKAFAGQHGRIEIFPVTFESRFLAAQIEGILINAKWTMPPSPKLLTAPPITTVQGVGIFSTPDEQSKAAAKELFRLLAPTAAGGVLIPPGPPKTSRTELPNPENPRVVVLVGDKPTPLRSWVK